MNIKKYIIVTIVAFLGLWWFYHSAYEQGYSVVIAKVEKQAQVQKDKSIKQERQAQQNLQIKLEKIEHEKQKLLWLISLCVVSLTACSNTSIPVNCPQPPAFPASLKAMNLPKAGSYSQTAQKNMQEWQK